MLQVLEFILPMPPLPRDWHPFTGLGKLYFYCHFSFISSNFISIHILHPPLHISAITPVPYYPIFHLRCLGSTVGHLVEYRATLQWYSCQKPNVLPNYLAAIYATCFSSSKRDADGLKDYWNWCHSWIRRHRLLGVIHILRQQMFGRFWPSPPLVIKRHQTSNLSSLDDVITVALF